jgi:hypothetical protein
MNLEHTLVDSLGVGGYDILGTLFFIAMAAILYRLAGKKN